MDVRAGVLRWLGLVVGREYDPLVVEIAADVSLPPVVLAARVLYSPQVDRLSVIVVGQPSPARSGGLRTTGRPLVRARRHENATEFDLRAIAAAPRSK